jgi:O-antigen/teichoic acid export membrane protein
MIQHRIINRYLKTLSFRSWMIARKSFLIIISQFLLRFMGWIGLWILARNWGGFAPEAQGIVGFAISFLAIFNILGDLGFSRAHVKRISEGRDLGKCIGTFITIKLVLIGFMLTIITDLVVAS